MRMCSASPLTKETLDDNLDNIVSYNMYSSFVVFDETVMKNNVAQWKREIGRHVNELLLDLVDNSNPYVLHRLLERSSSKMMFGVRSKSELSLALNDVGLKGDQLSLRAPLLTKGLLQAAMKAQVNEVRVSEAIEVTKTANFFPGAKLVLELKSESSFQALMESAVRCNAHIVGLSLPLDNKLSVEKGLALMDYALNLCREFRLNVEHVDLGHSLNTEYNYEEFGNKNGVKVRVNCNGSFLKGCFELHTKIDHAKESNDDNVMYVLSASTTSLLTSHILHQSPSRVPSSENGKVLHLETNEGMVVLVNDNKNVVVKNDWLVLKNVNVSTNVNMVAVEDVNCNHQRCLLYSTHG